MTNKKKKILVAQGHGPGSKHNRGFIGGNEGDYNYYYCEYLVAELRSYGFIVDKVRKKITDFVRPEVYGKMAAGYDLLLDEHTNATGKKPPASGAEVYDDTGTPNNKLASMVAKAISEAQGIKIRTPYSAKNGVNYRRLNNGSNYYASLRNNRAKSGLLVEKCFHDNPREVEFYKKNLERIAKAEARAIAEYYGYLKNKTSSVSGYKEEAEKVYDVNIMGESELSAAELTKWFESYKVEPKISMPIKDFIQIYIVEGGTEGVRGDVAFIQSVHETGKFQFTGDVIPEQNNFAGIGTVGGGVKGHFFDSPQQGVRAQIQHLKAYASKESLKNKKIDPRFDLVTRGSAKTVRGLTGKWATDKAYGDKLVNYYNAALKYKKEKGEDELKYNISILDKRDGQAALEVLFAGEEGSVISKGGNYKYGNDSDTEVIGIGKDRTSHTSYLDYFISGDTAADTLLKAKDFIAGNKEKYKAPKKGK